MAPRSVGLNGAMETALWILAGLLAIAFVGTGALKLQKSKAALHQIGMEWTDDFSQTQIRLIGVAEILGGIGLVLPPAIDLAPILSPIAATCLALAMVGALAVHLRRGETGMIPPPLVLAVLAGVLAVLRFGPYAF